MEKVVLNEGGFFIVEKENQYFLYKKKVDPFGTEHFVSKGSVKENPDNDELEQLLLLFLKKIDK